MAKGTNSFGGTIKLEGEAEYRKAISDIGSSLKVMGSEMSKVTAEFGKSNKSTEALSATNDVLNKKIEAQEQKVSLLKGALAEATSSQNTNKKTVDNWQVSLNKAEAELISMKKDVENNNETMKNNQEQTGKSSKEVKNFGDSSKEAGKSALGLGDIIKANLISDAVIGGIKAIASGIKNVTSSFKDGVLEATSYADEMMTMSTQTGMSVESLQKYKAVSELVDVDLNTITGSMAKMTKGLDSNAETYGKLGVSLKDANGELRSQDDIFMDTIDALGGVSNETERNQIAMDLFGKSAETLNPLIAQGSEGLKKLEDSAEAMGQVLSGKGVEALASLDDQIQIFKSNTTGLTNILSSAFAPELSSMMEGVNGLTGSFNELVTAVISGENMDEAMTDFKESIDELVASAGEKVPEMLNIVNELLTTIVQSISDNLPTILQGGMQILTTLIQGIVGLIPQLVPTIVQAITTILDTIIQNLPLIIQGAIEIIVALIKGLAEAIPTLIPTIVDAVITIAETLIDNLDLLIDAGIEIIFALIDGLIEALPKLIDKIPTIIDKLVNAIVNNLPKLLEAGIKIIIKLAEGLIKAIPQLISKIPQIISSLFNGFMSLIGRFGEIGGNIVSGIWQGISNSVQWITNKVKEFAKGILNSIKNALGIHSPSRVFKDEVGKNLALGLGEGFSDEMGTVTKEMKNAVPKNLDVGINMSPTVLSSSQSIAIENAEDRKSINIKDIIKEAMSEFMGVIELDNDKVGKYIIKKVTQEVYA